MPYWLFEFKSEARAKRNRYYAQCFFHEEDGSLTIIRRDRSSGEPKLREGPTPLRDPIARLLLFFLNNPQRELQIDALASALWYAGEARDKPVQVTLRKYVEELRKKLGDDHKELIRLGGPVGTYVFDAPATRYADLHEINENDPYTADLFDTGLSQTGVMLPDALLQSPVEGQTVILREIILLRRDGERRTVGFIPETDVSTASLFQLLNGVTNVGSLLRWANLETHSDEVCDTRDGLGVLIFRENLLRAYLGASSVRIELEWLTDRHVEPGGAVEAVLNNAVQLYPVSGAVRDDSVNHTITEAMRSFIANLRGFRR